MCDCYSHKCQAPDCNVHLEMHLNDYDTDRDEIEIYCEAHLPENMDDGVLWDVQLEDKSHTKFFVRSLTENARNNSEGNHPNIEEPYQELSIFGKKV